MNHLSLSTGFAGFVVLVAMPCVCRGTTYVLRRDNVISVVFEDKLTVRDNRPGDSFVVRVVDNGQLPSGTEFIGRIERVHPAKGNHPASMDLRFVEILLPDRSRTALDAAPIALDDKYITRKGDGRIVAKQDLRKQQNDVIGGAIGGFIIGSLFHHRVGGTVIGTMIGMSAAESERAKDSNLIVSSGETVGALINRDVMIDFSEPQTRFSINQRLDRAMDGPIRGYHGRVGGRRYSGEINLSFKSRDLSFTQEAAPYKVGTDVMVPLESTASQLRLEVDRRQDRTIYVDGASKNLRLTLNSRGAHLDGRSFDLPRTVLEINGIVYVPLAALLPLLNDDLMVNGKKFEPN